MISPLSFDYFFSSWHSQRTIPDIIAQDHMLAVGCSHTAGVGINEDENFVSHLSKILDTKIYNLGRPGGNHNMCAINVRQWLIKYQPRVIIAQWPNPFRTIAWENEKVSIETVSNTHRPLTDTMLKLGELNHMQSWIDTIINTNLLAKFQNITIINILLEHMDHRYHRILEKHDIIVHQDDKLPGRTWLFDNKASDRMHHSGQCHQQWATRIQGIIDENTTR